MLGISGAATSIATIGIAIYMLRRSNKRNLTKNK